MSETVPFVSIIMPAYNAELYLEAAINSVIAQDHERWELLVINDGSTDRTSEVVANFNDKRIQYFEQENQGVSAARNKGLKVMKGDFFCFLDADDIFPQESISSRLIEFKRDRELHFVDGKVIYTNMQLVPTGKKYVPSYSGVPFRELLRLNPHCFFGNTWMVKNELEISYQFQEDMTHSEDIYFYLTISQGRKYGFTKKSVLIYRNQPYSAMSNLHGLEKGYLHLITKASRRFPEENLTHLKWRITRIMLASWLKIGKNPIRGILSVVKIGLA